MKLSSIPGTMRQSVRVWAGQIWPPTPPPLDRLVIWGPVFFGVGCSAYSLHPTSLLTVEAWITLFTLLGVMGGALGLTRHSLWRITLILALSLTSLGYVWSHLRTPHLSDPQWEVPERSVVLTGWIEAIDLRGRDRLQIRVMTISDMARVPKRVSIRARVEGATPGDVIEVPVVLSQPPSPGLPGGYDPARRDWFEQIGFRGYAIGPLVEIDDAHVGDRWERAWLAWRWRLSKRIYEETGSKGGIASAVLTGERAFIEREDTDTLRAAGLGHILAISGLHMSLVCASLFFVVRYGLSWIPYLARHIDPRRPAALTALGVGAAYLILSGASVSTQRAFIMTAVVLVGFLLRRRSISMRALSLAGFIVLLITPWSVVEPGFQMSFAAAAALVAAYEGLRSRAKPAKKQQGLLRKGLNFVGGVSMTSLVAGTATGLIAAYHFQRWAEWGFVINVLAMPIFTVWVMPVGLISFALMPFGLSVWGFQLMNAGLELILDLCHAILGEAPTMHAIAAPDPWVYGVVILAGVLVVMGRGVLRPAGCFIALIGLAFWGISPQPNVFIQDGGVVVAQGQNEAWQVSSNRRGRFDVESFFQRIGEDDQNIEGFQCDDLGCTGVTADGVRLAVSEHSEALAEDCLMSQIIVFRGIVSARERRACGALILDDEDRARSGGSFLYTHRGQILRIETTQEGRDKQPWAQTPPGPQY